MSKCWQITNKLNIKLFKFYSVCKQFACIYISMKLTKMKFIPIINIFISIIFNTIINISNCKSSK